MFTKVLRSGVPPWAWNEYRASKIVGVTGLAVPGCLIEIECTAVAG
jgi:enamine deaminase RidA (YjgF/YER057c/UK114 family)